MPGKDRRSPLLRLVTRAALGCSQVGLLVLGLALLQAPHGVLDSPRAIAVSLTATLLLSSLPTVTDTLAGTLPPTPRAIARAYVTSNLDMLIDLVSACLLFAAVAAQAVAAIAWIPLLISVLVLGEWLLQKLGALSGPAGPLDLVTVLAFLGLLAFQAVYLFLESRARRHERTLQAFLRYLRTTAHARVEAWGRAGGDLGGSMEASREPD